MENINFSAELNLLMRWYDEAGALMRAAYDRDDQRGVSKYCKLQTALIELMHRFKRKETNEQSLSSPR